MRYSIRQAKDSRSFPPGDHFFLGAGSEAEAEVLIIVGERVSPDLSKRAILIELNTDCLAEHADEKEPQSRNIMGFARYRNGSDSPSNLLELVRFARTDEAAIAAARSVFEAAGLEVVVCTDQPGRILDRLLRPKYNAALRLLDEGLASEEDMDLTCKLGLGYPDGPLERVTRGGLQHHYQITKALFEAYGTAAYAPPRRAIAAARRGEAINDASA